MKRTAIAVFLGLLHAASPNYDKDVESVDTIIKALYEVISGEKGEERDWDRFRNLFHESGTLRSVNQDKNGEVKMTVMTPDQYIQRAGPYLINNGFFEREIGRRSENYRFITHIFSTYDSRNSEKDKKPFTRGINSIQLLNSNNRWYVISILWNGETKENPIPRKYLR